MTKKHFCNYEHLGGCCGPLTHRADYWMGAAREKFGRYAYWCEPHSKAANHIGMSRMNRTIKRTLKAEAA